MNARRVHAVLAAGVRSPNLIVEWQANPQFLLDQGIEPAALDLTAIWKFAGLAVKVRHNGLRRDFPCTFRLMRFAGLEVEVFASYATDCASKGQAYAATPELRAAELISFLGRWLDPVATDHALLWDMIRHEQAIARLNRPAVASSSCTAPIDLARPQPAPTESCVPRVCGEVILHEMQSDPRAVQLTLFGSPTRLREATLETHYFCYWASPRNAEVMILELDEFGYYTLSFVDGVRSVSELSCSLGAGDSATGSFVNLLGQLGAIGILDFSPASATAVP